MKTKDVTLLIILFVIFAIALYFVFYPPFAQVHNHGGPTGPVPPDVRNQVNEVLRLEELANKQHITQDDFSTLETMLEGNDVALDEVSEIKVLVKYQEYEHASHGLGFLAVVLSTGKKPVCPGHSLLHYYIYEKHGETDLASGQLSEAEEGLPLLTNAEVSQRIQQDIDAIHAGTLLASDAEIDYLNSVGSVCVG